MDEKKNHVSFNNMNALHIVGKPIVLEADICGYLNSPRVSILDTAPDLHSHPSEYPCPQMSNHLSSTVHLKFHATE